MNKNLILAFFLLPTIAFSQSLKENKIDEFTKNAVMRTSWETLTMTGKLVFYYRVSKINGTPWLNVKFSNQGKGFVIGSGISLMIKLANDSVLSFSTHQSEMSCRGCGATGLVGSTAQGVDLSYTLNQEDINMLKFQKIVKIRVYTTDGYIEEDVKDKRSDTMPIALGLIETKAQ